jgi:Mrp family chromosome partitioning ATPase
MAELRERYEVVVFDAASLNRVTDAAVLGRAADATLLIARMGATDKEALQHATAQLRHLRVPVSGVVLNDFSETYAGELHGGNGSDGKSG